MVTAEEHIQKAEAYLASAKHSYNNEARAGYGALATAHIAMATYIRQYGSQAE